MELEKQLLELDRTEEVQQLNYTTKAKPGNE